MIIKTSNSDWKSRIYEGKAGKLPDKSKIRTFLLLLPDVLRENYHTNGVPRQ
jgi:hypothetical protein